MCGRYAIRTSTPELARIFGIEDADQSGWDELVLPSFNVAPTHMCPIVGLDRRGAWSLVPMRWGLVPSWAKDAKIGSRMINARAETVGEKPAFRAAFKRRRCLVPATGFYEWQRKRTGKQPFHIGLANGPVFCFAGLWESWKLDSEQTLYSFAIITTEANETVSDVHDRMPVILDPNDYETWVTHPTQDAEPAEAADINTARSLLHPFANERMHAYAVSKRVNSVRNNDEACLEASLLEQAPDGGPQPQ